MPSNLPKAAISTFWSRSAPLVTRKCRLKYKSAIPELVFLSAISHACSVPSAADASISRRHGGTGLGTVITQKLVNEMGGDISFHSQPNRGSTFWFHISLDLNPNVLVDRSTTLCPPVKRLAYCRTERHCRTVHVRYLERNAVGGDLQPFILWAAEGSLRYSAARHSGHFTRTAHHAA